MYCLMSFEVIFLCWGVFTSRIVTVKRFFSIMSHKMSFKIDFLLCRVFASRMVAFKRFFSSMRHFMYPEATSMRWRELTTRMLALKRLLSIMSPHMSVELAFFYCEIFASRVVALISIMNPFLFLGVTFMHCRESALPIPETCRTPHCADLLSLIHIRTFDVEQWLDLPLGD